MLKVRKIAASFLLLLSVPLSCCERKPDSAEITVEVTLQCDVDNSQISIPAAIVNRLRTIKNLVSDMQTSLVPLPADYASETVRNLITILNAAGGDIDAALNNLDGEKLKKAFNLANYLAAEASVLLMLYQKIKQKGDASLELQSVVQDVSLAVTESVEVDRTGHLNVANKGLARMHNIAHAQQVKSLDVSNNFIEEFEIPDRNLRLQIEAINASNNRIRQLVRGSLCKLPATLRHIDLRGNAIDHVEPGFSDGVQQGLTVNIDNSTISEETKADLRKQIETESNTFRYYHRLGATAATWACHPFFSNCWMVPLNVFLAAKFGHTRTWKLCNVGLNGLALYDAIRQRDVGHGVRLLLDSCQQFNGLTIANNFLHAKIGYSPASFVNSSNYNTIWWWSWWARLLLVKRQSLRRVASQVFDVVDATQLFVPTTFKAKWGFWGLGWRRFFVRQAGFASLAIFVHNRFDAWLQRTQNKVQFHFS